jgi:plastocyanin
MATRQLVASLMIAVIVGCGGSGGSSQSNYPTDPSSGSKGTGGTTTGERTSSISVVNSSYSPTATTVARGTVVQWTWNSCSDSGYGGEVCTAHTVTFDDGPSSELQDKGSYSRAFNTAGTYKYHCQVHGSSMSGSVVVE